MASRGLGARRTCDDIIRQGRVRVNGLAVTEPGCAIDAHRDTVEVDGKILEAVVNLVYILLNKPVGYVVTARDPQGRPTVYDIVTGLEERIFSVGRLDADVEGLLLLTNDGDLSYRLTHPRYEVEKTYRVLVAGRPDRGRLEDLQRGVQLEDGPTAPTDISVLQEREGESLVEMKMHEGRKRQVKRMWAAVGHPVKRLVRTGLAALTLEGLKTGQWRHLTPDEVRRLRELVGLEP